KYPSENALFDWCRISRLIAAYIIQHDTIHVTNRGDRQAKHNRAAAHRTVNVTANRILNTAQDTPRQRQQIASLGIQSILRANDSGYPRFGSALEIAAGTKVAKLAARKGHKMPHLRRRLI